MIWTPDLIITAALVMIASQSPLQTFAALWQVKEWRIDRLWEHLRSEDALRQLLGVARPTLIAIGSIVVATDFAPVRLVIGAVLWILAGGAALQFQLRRQPRPVGTQKARVLLAGATGITAACVWMLLQNGSTAAWLALSTIPLLQPFMLLLAWAAFWRVDKRKKRAILEKARQLRAQYPELIVIGITGSVGKTTTKELLAHLLKEKGAIATPAHVNTELGVSLWFLQTFGESQEAPPPILIVEMGAYRRGEIALLASVMRPTLGVISFLGTQHIALFGSQEALIHAKGELLEALPENGRAFLNEDSPFVDRLKERCTCPVTTVGTGTADMRAEDVEETTGGIRFRLGDTEIRLPLHGTHNVTNVLLAVAVAEHCGMDRARISKILSTFPPPEHTFSVREERGITILDATHNASPASFTAAINWAKAQPGNPKVLLTPGLIEQGEEQDRVHVELGAAAATVFDRAVFLHRKSAQSFERGFGRPVELLANESPAIPTGALLVCIGRMPQRAIDLLLP